MEFEFSRLNYGKNAQILNFMIIRLVEAELFHAERQRETTKLIVVFRSFLKVPKRWENKMLVKLMKFIAITSLLKDLFKTELCHQNTIRSHLLIRRCSVGELCTYVSEVKVKVKLNFFPRIDNEG